MSPIPHSPLPFVIKSSLFENPNLGIAAPAEPLKPQSEIVVDGDVVKWYYSAKGVGIGPYPYTTELKGEVLATDNYEAARDWVIIPINEGGRESVIATDDTQRFVWTAEGLHKPIRIEPFQPGNVNQVFKIESILPEKELS